MSLFDNKLAKRLTPLIEQVSSPRDETAVWRALALALTALGSDLRIRLVRRSSERILALVSDLLLLNTDSEATIAELPLSSNLINAMSAVGAAQWKNPKTIGLPNAEVIKLLPDKVVCTVPICPGAHSMLCLQWTLGTPPSHDVLTYIIQCAALASAAIASLTEQQTRQQLSDKVAFTANKITSLHTISRNLSGAESEHHVFSSVIAPLREILGPQRISFATREPDGEHLRILSTNSGSKTINGTVVPGLNNPASEVISSGNQRLYTDLSSSPYPEHVVLGTRGIQVCMTVPVIANEVPIGALSCATTEYPSQDDDYLEMLSVVAGLMGTAIERVRLQAQASAALRAMFDNSPILLISLDNQGTILQVSRFGASALGYHAEDLVGRHFSVLHPPERGLAVDRRLARWSVMFADQVESREVEMQRADGVLIWARQRVRHMDSATDGTSMLIVCEDVSKVRELALQLENQAKSDALTGLPNRFAFDELLASSLIQARAQNNKLAVLFLDLDRFKEVNDTRGHAAGDRLLCMVSERISAQVRSQDTVSRIGGDEYQVLLPAVGNADHALAVGESIRRAIENPFDLNGEMVSIGCSIGISCFPEDSDDPEGLLGHADMAMYRAKELGRNNVQLYTSQLSNKVRARKNIENALRQGIGNGELRLALQPQFSMPDRTIRSVEALVRWQRPGHGLISPGEFIPVAEETGMVSMITDWVLDQSLSVISALRQSDPDLRIAVNVSAREFLTRHRLVERVFDCLEQHNVPPSCLEIEITESALLDDAQTTHIMLAKLREHGVHVALDDFGTGYASLSYLVNLPIDVVKIDRSFVDGIEFDPRKQGIVDGITRIATNLNMVCVAEGVETELQLAYLNSVNCHSVQGFLLAKPMSPTEFIDLIRSPKEHSNRTPSP